MTLLAYVTVWVAGALVMLVIAPLLVSLIIAVDATLGGVWLQVRLHPVLAVFLRR